MDLWNRINYTSEISYLVNTLIYEFDIQKCNINVLREAGVLDQETYEYLWNAERMVRQCYVGNMCKNPEIERIRQSGTIEAKRKFFMANKIQDSEVLSIKNDAVFIISRVPPICDFGMIHFIKKHQYTGFYKVLNLELYFLYNSVTQEEGLDVKGINDEMLMRHQQYFLQFLKDLFYTIQMNGVAIALRLLKQFYLQYINLGLPIGFYRKFDPLSDYHFKFKSIVGAGFGAENVGEEMKKFLDISYNLNILRELQKILISIFFSK